MGRPRMYANGNPNRKAQNQALELSTDALQIKLNQLDSKSQLKVIQRTLLQAGNILTKKTRELAKGSYKVSRSQLRAPRAIKDRRNKTGVKVHILGGTKKNADEYKLKFHETGTLSGNNRGRQGGKRVTVSGYSYTNYKGTRVNVNKTGISRGSLKGFRFFQRAQDQTNKTVSNFIDTKVNENILKIWNAKHG